MTTALAVVLQRWFPALQERNVRLYVFGQAVSILGTWVLDITLNLVIWEATKSPALLGLLNLLLYIPGLAVTPMFSASLSAENARRRTLSVLAVALALAAALTLCAAAGWLTPAVVLSLAFVKGLLTGMELPARQMLLTSSLSDASQIGGAVALNVLVFQVARMTGPALAALLFSFAGPAWGLAFSALGVAIMLAIVQRVEMGRGLAPTVRPESGRGLAAALRFVLGDSFGRIFLPALACVALFAGGYQTLVPVLADREFGDTTRWTSLFFGAAGAGALAGAILLATGLAPLVLRRAQVVVPWLAALALVGLWVSREPAISMACFAFIGFGMVLSSTGTNAVLHQRVPAETRSGLIALLLMSFNGMLPLAQLGAGLLAQRYGVRVTFLLMGLSLMAALAILFVPRWRALGRIELNVERL